MSKITKEKELRNKIVSLSTEFYNHVYKDRLVCSPQNRIDYAGRVFDHEELNLLIEACLDFWLTEGRYAEQFASNLSDFLKVSYCSLTNSGSSANLIAFMALTVNNLKEKKHIRKGDEVITVAAGFPTTVAPIVQHGAVPVFVDISLPSYNVDCFLLENALTSKTRAVMLAHTLGNPFDIGKVIEFCNKNNLWLIEDNCDALGSRYCYNGKWQYTGSFGDVSTSSFYPPHHITTGEGGAVYTSNKRIHKNVLSFRDWGRDCWCRSGKDNTCKQRFSMQFGDLPKGYDHKYVYSNFGFNLKMTEMQAAIGCAQLSKLKFFIERRKQNWRALKKALTPYEDIFILPEATSHSEPSWFGFPLTIRKDQNLSRDTLVRFLESNNIQTRMLFAGNIVRQPCFNEMRSEKKGYRMASSLDITDFVMKNTFWIGVYPGLSEDHIDYMIRTIERFFADKNIYKK